jgi:hypothetical protein
LASVLAGAAAGSAVFAGAAVAGAAAGAFAAGAANTAAAIMQEAINIFFIKGTPLYIPHVKF